MDPDSNLARDSNWSRAMSKLKLNKETNQQKTKTVTRNEKLKGQLDFHWVRLIYSIFLKIRYLIFPLFHCLFTRFSILMEGKLPQNSNVKSVPKCSTTRVNFFLL